MRIQHNIAALNSHRQLGGNNSAVGKNLEKLSSGYRINRAGDDAAGLAISEKMRAQIKGLETASKNAEDGVSLIQTAEGALTEVHSMLNRMVELSTQAANGTYGETERQKIQDEIDALTDEIDRIADATDFNGTKLLNGSLGGYNLDVDNGLTTSTNGLKSIMVSGGSLSNGDVAASIGLATDGTFTVDTTDLSVTVGSTTLDNAHEIISGKTVGGTNFKGLKIEGSGVVANENGTYTFKLTVDKEAVNTIFASDTGTYTEDVQKEVLSALSKLDGVTITATTGTKTGGNFTALAKTGLTVTAKADGSIGNGLVLQVGDTDDTWQKVNVNVLSMKAKDLEVDGVDVSSDTAAAGSIKSIKEAIEKVSTQRGQLGALQNRLDHTINNLGVTTENMTAAESRIRDVDMAKEMMDFTKNNILTQAAQAMLAQANQIPQGVLQLLQ